MLDPWIIEEIRRREEERRRDEQRPVVIEMPAEPRPVVGGERGKPAEQDRGVAIIDYGATSGAGRAASAYERLAFMAD